MTPVDAINRNVGNNLFKSKKGGLDESQIVLPQKYSPSEAVVPKEITEEPNMTDYPIQLNKVSASWTGNDNSKEMTLKNISLRVRKGKLCAVIGPVGSGKVIYLFIDRSLCFTHCFQYLHGIH